MFENGYKKDSYLDLFYNILGLFSHFEFIDDAQRDNVQSCQKSPPSGGCAVSKKIQLSPTQALICCQLPVHARTPPLGEDIDRCINIHTPLWTRISEGG